MSEKHMKHTPGPWSVQKFNDTKSWSIYAIGGSRSLASVRDEANAHVMASAPDLLAERDRLRAENAELRAALDGLMAWIAPQPFREQGDAHPVTIARLALAKLGR